MTLATGALILLTVIIGFLICVLLSVLLTQIDPSNHTDYEKV